MNQEIKPYKVYYNYFNNNGKIITAEIILNAISINHLLTVFSTKNIDHPEITKIEKL